MPVPPAAPLSPAAPSTHAAPSIPAAPLTRAAPSTPAAVLEAALSDLGRESREAFAARTRVRRAIVDDASRSERPADALASWIATIDRALEAQVNAILHAPAFRALEASWRSVAYLVGLLPPDDGIRVRVLNVSKRDLLHDLEDAVEFDQSAVFKKVYEEEYGRLGGEPFGLLVGDYEFGRDPEDVEMLRMIAGVAAAAHAPFVAGASASLFGWDDFAELAGPVDLEPLFTGADAIAWRSLREREDARYLALALPRVRLRAPYTRRNPAGSAFPFVEELGPPDAAPAVWGNAAFAFAGRVLDAFHVYRWCVAIRGLDGGGIVEGLPAVDFDTDADGVARRPPTDVVLTPRREKDLADLGLLPLCAGSEPDRVAFFSAQSLYAPPLFSTPQARANARLATQLPYVLAVSRFAHYVKVILRDKVGTLRTRERVERDLNDWIHRYVLLDDEASPEQKRKMPLREARVSVRERSDKPGHLVADLHLQPHFQTEEVSVAMRLVTELPEGAAGGR